MAAHYVLRRVTFWATSCHKEDGLVLAGDNVSLTSSTEWLTPPTLKNLHVGIRRSLLK